MDLSLNAIQKNFGTPSPLGLSFTGKNANFALFSKSALKCTLLLYGPRKLIASLPMHRTGNIWHIGIENLPPNLEYAFACERKGKTLTPLMDPYAKIMGNHKPKAAPLPIFPWKEGGTRIHKKKEDLIIYEMHVKGFTKDPASNVQHPGTFLGLIEKIPYLKQLGNRDGGGSKVCIKSDKK